MSRHPKNSSPPSWPEPAHLTFGMWFDRPHPGAGLLPTCEALQRQGANLNGAAWIGPADTAFSWVREVSLRTVDGPPPASVQDLLGGDGDEMPYRVGMSLTDLGPVAVTFDGVSGEPRPAAGHPVVLLMEADVFGIPRDEWDATQRRQAKSRQRAVLRCAEALCEALDPAYLVVGVEQLTPVPGRLARGDSLAWDAYIADRVQDASPPLRAALAEVTARGRLLRWKRGGFSSGWFLGEADDREAFRTAWASASRLVGQTLTGKHG